MFEVRSLVKPEEPDRNPTWFAPLEAKRKLGERRASKYSAQLANLVDEAVERVTSERTHSAVREVGVLRRVLAQR